MPATPTVLAERLEAVEALDAPAAAIAGVVRSVTEPVKPLLSGAWLGHAIHPVLTDVPIGTWTSALLLDVLGGSDGRGAADKLVGIGLLATVPTVITGWSDWGDEQERSPAIRRAGIAHAACNAAGAGLMAVSLAARRRGDRGTGLLWSAAGMAFMGTGAWLGGHLSYTRGAGVLADPVPNAATA